jgi:hypothetical protein
MIAIKMKYQGTIFLYNGAEVRYVCDMPNGQAKVLFQGAPMIVDRHELTKLKNEPVVAA